MFGQPVRQKNIKVLFRAIRIFSGNYRKRTEPFERKQHRAFCYDEANTLPDPLVYFVDDYRIKQVKETPLKNNQITVWTLLMMSSSLFIVTSDQSSFLYFDF